jgi:type IV pilus assembly protein PilM
VAKFDVSDFLTEVLKIGPRNLVGVDIGLHSIKVCELVEGKGSFKIQKFAVVQLPEGCLLDDEIQKHDELADGISNAIKAAGIKNRNCCVGMYGPNTIAKRLELPTSSPDDVEDQVMWESEQYIPFGVEDSTVDFHIIGENMGGGLDVLIAAARNDVVEQFGQLVEDSGSKFKKADLQLFSLTNVFEFVYEDFLSKMSDETVVLLDFGAQKTNLVVYRHGSIIFTKEINVGGIMITEEIQREMGLNYIEAEGLKIHGDEKGNLPQEIVEIISTMLDSFYSEIKKALNFFMTASSIESVDYCFITGGSSLIPGLHDGLEKLMGIKVQYLNPFDRLGFNSKGFAQEDLNSIATIGVTSIGLAMRSLDR